MQNRNAVLTALAKRPRSERADRRCGTGEITPILRHCFCSLGVVSSVPHLPVPHLPTYFGAGLVVWVIGIVSPYLFGSSEAAHERRLSQREAINEMSFYPNETILWDENVVPSEHYTGETCLALPKLNLQFLTFHDYLLRNFTLFKLESTYEIRDSILPNTYY